MFKCIIRISRSSSFLDLINSGREFALVFDKFDVFSVCASAKGKAVKKHAGQTQLNWSICWRRLYFLSFTWPHFIWHHSVHWSQLNARWFLAITLLQTEQFVGPGFNSMSPLTVTCISWNLESEFGQYCTRDTKKPLRRKDNPKWRTLQTCPSRSKSRKSDDTLQTRNQNSLACGVLFYLSLHYQGWLRSRVGTE